MTKRITREDCEARLRSIAVMLHVPLLSDYESYKGKDGNTFTIYASVPGNALSIYASKPDRNIRARVVTKDGRDPFGGDNCLSWRELYEKLLFAQRALTVMSNLGNNDFSDYRKGF
jgi:hypothetical protein